MAALISVRDLSVTFHSGLGKPRIHAVRDLALAVEAGEIVSVLGPNGSGKTTLLRVLAGVLRPTGGEVKVLGKHPTDRRLVREVGFQPDEPLPFRTLSGLEFLLYIGSLMGLGGKECKASALHWLTRLGLEKDRLRRVGHYSTGMQRRLAVAAALLPQPKVLLLDEPTAGLDPEGSLLVMEILREHREAGRATLMASHDMQEVEQISNRVVLLWAGSAVATGTLDELLATGDHRLVVRGLDEAGLTTVREAIDRAGGELMRSSQDRQHLFALFRQLDQSGQLDQLRQLDRPDG